MDRGGRQGPTENISERNLLAGKFDRTSSIAPRKSGLRTMPLGENRDILNLPAQWNRQHGSEKEKEEPPIGYNCLPL